MREKGKPGSTREERERGKTRAGDGGEKNKDERRERKMGDMGGMNGFKDGAIANNGHTKTDWSVAKLYT